MVNPHQEKFMSTALRSWRPFGMIEPFRNEMESLFERFFGEDGEKGSESSRPSGECSKAKSG